MSDTLKPDFAAVQEACEEYLAWYESAEYHPDREEDYQNAIFEAALEACFGAGIWDRVKERSERFYEEEAKGRG